MNRNRNRNNFYRAPVRFPYVRRYRPTFSDNKIRRNRVNNFRIRNSFNANQVRNRFFRRRNFWNRSSRFNVGRRQRFRDTNTNRNMSNYFNSSQVSAPQGAGYNVENAQRTTIVLDRVGFIHPLVAKSKFSIQAFDMHPTLLPWVKTLCSMYNKYMFTKLSVRYIGQCPATSGGSAFVAFDFDPHQALPDNVWRAQAFDKFVMCPVWSTSTWITVAPNVLMDKWYDNETGVQSQLDSWHDKHPGRIIVGVSGANAVSADIEVGQIEVNYCVKLTRPTAHGAEDGPKASQSYVAEDDDVSICVDDLSRLNLEPVLEVEEHIFEGSIVI